MKSMKVPGILLISLLFLPSLMHAQEGTVPAGNVDLLWQGEVYTPPFYLGRALWGSQSRITVTAIPHTSGSAASLAYRWSKDGDFLSAVSGAGKRSLSFADSILSRKTTVKVEVLSADGTEVLASGSVTISPRVPELIVVEDNPLYGLMLHRAVGKEFALDESEVSFVALPFFSDLARRTAGEAEYTWSTSVGDSREGNSVTYRIPEGADGASLVTLKMINSKALTQPAQKSFLVQFGEQANI
jgi:hypothetical protein